MSNNDPDADETTAPADEPAVPVELPLETGRLLDPWKADAVEAEDRRSPIPGGEPHCPECQGLMRRQVEKHPAPRAGSSPFRVRLVCVSETCGAWTVYDW